jgi:hypothetical protein
MGEETTAGVPVRAAVTDAEEPGDPVDVAGFLDWLNAEAQAVREYGSSALLV